MNCIILGDKFQKGMKSKGCSALLKINKKLNVLNNQYSVLKEIIPNINITYVYGFDGKRLLEYYTNNALNISLVLNEKYNLHNQVFSLSLANHLFQDSVLVVDGYKQLNKKIFKKFDQDNGSQIFITNNINKDNYVPGCTAIDNKIEYFSYDLDNNIANIYYFSKADASAIQNLLTQEKYYNSFIFEILNRAIENGIHFKPLIVD